MTAFVSGLRYHRRNFGADLSSVDVGLSLTVENGLVPLQKIRVNKRGKEMLEREKGDCGRKHYQRVPNTKGYDKRNKQCISKCTSILWQTADPKWEGERV